jgi:hypothetical protein
MLSEERGTRVESGETKEVDDYGAFERSAFERMVRSMRDQNPPIQRVTWRRERPEK